MARWTVGRMMLGIAGIAVLLGGYCALEAYQEGCTFVCSRHTQCASNERNVILSILGYVHAKGSFPTGTWPNPDLLPEERLSWYYGISDDLDYQGLSRAVDSTAPWYGPANAPVAGTRLGVLACPDAPRTLSGGLIPTAYIGIAGLGTDAPILPEGHPRAGIFGYDRRTTLKDITDGAAFTMVLAESDRVQGSWLAGGPATVRGLDPADQPYLGPRRPFGGRHQPRGTKGANVAFADGSVRFIPDTIDPRIFEAFSTIAGDESLPPDLFRQEPIPAGG